MGDDTKSMIMAVVGTVVILIIGLGVNSGQMNAYRVMEMIEIVFTRVSTGQAFFDAEGLGAAEWTKLMRDSHKTIYQEFLDYEVEIPEATFILPKANPNLSEALWRTGWIKMYGTNTAMARSFPKTIEILSKTPIITAQFSVFDPSKELDWHRGPYKGVLRYLLHLHVPTDPADPSCVNDLLVRNGTEEHRNVYHEGGDVIFDDAFFHYAANRCKLTRVSLFCDFPRPDMPLWARGLNAIMVYLFSFSGTLAEKLEQIEKFQAKGKEIWKGTHMVENRGSGRTEADVLVSDQGHSMLARSDFK